MDHISFDNVSVVRKVVGDCRVEGEWRRVRTERGIEGWLRKTFRNVTSGRVSAVRVVEWLESRSVGQPESAKRAEDDEWEGVAENELAERPENHEEAAEEEVDTG